jgi:hypothetical protein
MTEKRLINEAIAVFKLMTAINRARSLPLWRISEIQYDDRRHRTTAQLCSDC